MSDAPERVWMETEPEDVVDNIVMWQCYDVRIDLGMVEYIRANIHDAEVAFLREGRDKLVRSLKVVNDRTDELDDEVARLREALEEIADPFDESSLRDGPSIARRALEDSHE